MGKIAAFKKPTAKDQSDLSHLVEEYLADLASLNKSKHTVTNFRSDLKTFLRFYQGRLEELSAPILRQYFSGDVAALSPTTQARKRCSLKSFLHWCYQEDLIASNPMNKLGTIKLPETQPRFLPLDQVRRILAVIKDDRDKLLFTLISETGLRISEALSLSIDDLRLDSQELRVFGKGQRERTVHLVKTESLRLLKSYIRKHGLTDGLVFRPDPAKQRYGVVGNPLTYSVICRAWNRYRAEAGIDCTIHQLRHSYATDLINRGVAIEIVGKILGHKNLQTTTRYASVSDQTVKKALEAAR